MGHMTCLRCKRTMQFLGEQKLQLGQTGWVLGDLPNLFAGAMAVAVFRCPGCGKLEFFDAGMEYAQYSADREFPRRTCPECGAEHDGDCCPICGYDHQRK